jgi:hypothetical protein
MRKIIKFNLIDVALVLAIILVALAIYNKIFPPKSFKKMYDVPAKKWFYAEIIVPSDKEWLYKYIKIGDRQIRMENKVSAEIMDIYYSQEFDKKERLIVKLKILAALEPGQYPLFGRHTLRVGEQIIFSTATYILTGYVAKAEEAVNERKHK